MCKILLCHEQEETLFEYLVEFREFGEWENISNRNFAREATVIRVCNSLVLRKSKFSGDKGHC